MITRGSHRRALALGLTIAAAVGLSTIVAASPASADIGVDDYLYRTGYRGWSQPYSPAAA